MWQKGHSVDYVQKTNVIRYYTYLINGTLSDGIVYLVGDLYYRREDGIEETLAYCDFPSEHWSRIRTNNVIERLNREIRRRTRVVGSFPDGNSALMLVCARLRHVAGTQWGNKKYMNMKHLEDALEDASIAS